MRRMNLLLALIFSFTTALGEVVDKTEFPSGGTFTVTCNIAKFTSPVPPNRDVNVLSMQRNVSSAYTDIAVYEPNAVNPDNRMSKTIPFGKSWDIQFSGGTGIGNRETVKIVMVANNSQCDDAGLYRCIAIFSGSATTTYYSSVTNLTASVQVSQNDIVMEPHRQTEGTNEFSSVNPVGENITMKCTYSGPLRLQTSWKYTTKDLTMEQSYPVTNDITESNPQSISSTAGCTTYSYQSVLAFQVQQTDDGNTYYCIVMSNNGVELSRRNFTIGIESTTEIPDSGAAASSAGPDVGAIVGGVIGGVVLLVLIVVLVYFFVIRKRKSGSDEDKRKNVETTDNGKDNFTPPPVFYSKPHKPPKDESDGSRPVGMTNDALDISYDSKDLKGPPQYTNTVDDYEPPGYEKEIHRGRANKAYEEEKEEKKEGHRSRRHRDRGEEKEKEPEDKDRREDRRSRHRDRGEAEPKSRHYSTEDGTDDRYIGYGDPNMGTSI